MAYGFTKTLPTISGSHSQFTVELRNADFPTAAIGTDPNAIANGGGDLRAYEDYTKTVQLPLEIVRFVTGASPDIHVEVQITTAETGATIYLEADDVETSQPAVTATYGRNNTWSGDEAILHMENAGNGTVDEFLDSTGNGYDGQLTTGTSLPITTSGHPRGGEWVDFDTTQAVTLKNSNTLVNNTAFSITAQAAVDVSSTSDAIFGNRWSGSSDWAGIQSSRRGFSSSGTGGENLADAGARATGVYKSVAFTQSNSLIALYDDGVQVASDASISAAELINNTTTSNNFRVATYFNNSSSFRLDGRVGLLRVRRDQLSANWLLTEHENRSAAGSWGTNSAWEDQAGGSNVVVGLASDTESAFSVTPVKPILKPVGLASDTESAFTVTPVITGGQEVIVGLASDTESAFSVDIVKPGSVIVGLASDTESAFSVTPFKPIFVDVGLASDTESAPSVTAANAKMMVVGLASDTESAFSVTPVKPINVSVGIASDVETAQAVFILAEKFIEVGLASDTESAFSVNAVSGAAVDLDPEAISLMSASELFTLGSGSELFTTAATTSGTRLNSLDVTPAKT